MVLRFANLPSPAAAFIIDEAFDYSSFYLLGVNDEKWHGEGTRASRCFPRRLASAVTETLLASHRSEVVAQLTDY